MEEKTPLAHIVVCFQMLDFNVLGLKIKFKYFSGKLLLSHNVLYYQQLSIARYQGKFLC